MKLLGLVIGALVAVAASGPALAQSKCELKQFAALPLEFKNNRPLVEVAINGVKAKMLIDTGANKSILFAPKLRAMGFAPTPGDVEFEGVGGIRKALEITLKTFDLGGSAAKNIHFFALESGGFGEAVGLLGEDLLVNSDVEFDLVGKQLRLFREKDCGGVNLGYWTKEPAVADMTADTDLFGILVKLNGVTMHAQIDSGSDVSVVTASAAGRVGVQPKREEIEGVSGGIGSSKVAVSTVTFATLAVGDEEIKNAKLLVGDFFRAARQTSLGSSIATSSQDETEMLIGADFLRSHRVMIAKGQKLVYFTYQGGPVFQVVAPVDKPEAAATK